MGMVRKNAEPIEFVTDQGRHVVLIFEKTEYRAYEVLPSGRREMHLGSLLPDPLVRYIKERW